MDSSFTVTIIGTNSFGEALTEVVNITSFDFYYYTQYAYNKITSIICYQVDGNIQTVFVSIGIAGGYTGYYIADVFNKNSQYTIAYSDMSGTNSITPTYMIEKPFAIFDNQQEYNTDSTTWYAVPIGSGQVVVSPTTVTAEPVTVNCAVSFKFPISALFTVVPDASTGSFVQTIIQQGAYA